MPPNPESMLSQWFRRVWNENDPGAIDDLLAPDGVVHGLADEPIRGPAEFRAFHQAFSESVGRIRLTVQREISARGTDGDEVNVAWGRVVVMGPTGRTRVGFDGCAWVRHRDGRIQEGWNSWDFLGLLERMSLLPAGSLGLALTQQLRPHPQVRPQAVVAD
jgi:hypothetical protein